MQEILKGHFVKKRLETVIKPGFASYCTINRYLRNPTHFLSLPLYKPKTPALLNYTGCCRPLYTLLTSVR